MNLVLFPTIGRRSHLVTLCLALELLLFRLFMNPTGTRSGLSLTRLFLSYYFTYPGVVSNSMGHGISLSILLVINGRLVVHP
jgi:hypothetical protein